MHNALVSHNSLEKDTCVYLNIKFNMKHKNINFTIGELTESLQTTTLHNTPPPPALLPKEQGKMTSKFLSVNNGFNHKGGF